MSSSILLDKWMQVIRKNGDSDVIAPFEITSNYEENPVVDFDWNLPEIRMSNIELLIGILTNMCPPSDNLDWWQKYKKPIATEDLLSAFLPYKDNFLLDGDGVRFMQTLEDLPYIFKQKKKKKVADTEAEDDDNSEDSELVRGAHRLLQYAPGEQTVKNNTDLFEKRTGLVFPVHFAGLLLYHYQSRAISGGRGTYSSLRGGSPFSSIAVPSSGCTLWELLWANVQTITDGEAARPDDSTVFPWIAKPLLAGDMKSNKNPFSHVDNERKIFMAYWAMPRRVRLITKEVDGNIVVANFMEISNGTMYSDANIRHPLNGYVIKDDKKGGGIDRKAIECHGQIKYDDYASVSGNKNEAACVSDFSRRRAEFMRGQNWEVLYYGYAADKAKIDNFVISSIPGFVFTDAGPDVHSDENVSIAQFLKHDMINASRFISNALKRGIEAVILARVEVKGKAQSSASVKGLEKSSVYESIRANYTRSANVVFERTLKKAMELAQVGKFEDEQSGLLTQFYRELSGIAFKILRSFSNSGKFGNAKAKCAAEVAFMKNTSMNNKDIKKLLNLVYVEGDSLR